jgi:hypothetical protein
MLCISRASHADRDPAVPAAWAGTQMTCSGCTHGLDVRTSVATPQLGGVFAIGYRDAASSVSG